MSVACTDIKWKQKRAGTHTSRSHITWHYVPHYEQQYMHKIYITSKKKMKSEFHANKHIYTIHF